MRLIDGDALIPMMKYATTDSEIGVFPIKIGFNAITEVINNAPTINSMQRWIPVSERLPIDDDYRESMECLDWCVWYFTDKGLMGLGYYYYSTKEWSTLQDLKPDGKVIAWMPLPKPYQEVEHE